MAAPGIPWFTGHPEEVEAANIRAQRQLAALGAVTAPVGRLLGAMRQQQQDQAKADLANERLGATLGVQADKANAQSTPMGGGMSSDQYGAGMSIAAGPGTDPTALTAPPAPTQPAQKGFLSRFASGLKDVGMRALSAAGAETGLGAPYTPEFMQTAKSVAQREGQVERQKLANARLEAMQGMHPVEPGEAAYKATGGTVDLRGLKFYPPPMDPLSGNKYWEALVNPDAPGHAAAVGIHDIKQHDTEVNKPPTPRRFTYPKSQGAALSAIVSDMKNKPVNKKPDGSPKYTDRQFVDKITNDQVDQYLQLHPNLWDPVEHMQSTTAQMANKTLSKLGGSTTTTPGATASEGVETPSTENSDIFDEDENPLGYDNGQ